MLRIVNISIIGLLFISFSQGQEKNELKGKVIDSETGFPIEMVTIGIQACDRWTTTNREGEFVLTNLPAGTIQLCATYIGYEKACKTVKLDGTIFELIELNKTTLAIDEITVRAKESQGIGSVSDISMQALEHIQPTNLSDALQLLPGQISQNPDFSGPNQLKIRDFESNSDPNASMGTALIIDGAQISNDANMQVMSTASSITGGIGGSAYNSSATGGVDVRGISLDNIESIEVVRGIPSAEHGDLTSGAVIVKTKAGYTPLSMKLKTDPRLKLFSMDKGFQLPENRGAINLQADYTDALNDLRFRYKSYNRVTGYFGYSNTFFRNDKPLSLNFKSSYSSNINEQKTDSDVRDVEDYKASDERIRMNVFGTWSLNKNWITKLKYNVNAGRQWQHTKISELESLNGAQPLYNSYETALYETIYLPSNYLSDVKIEGKPYNFSAKLVGNVNHNFGRVFNNFILGADWKTNGNNGQGRVFDTSLPPNPVSNNATRPRSFQEIPALNQLSIFAEDLLTFDIGKSLLEVQAGLRYTNLQPNGLIETDITRYFDPRINFKWQIVSENNKSFIQEFVLKGGTGIATKAPTLLHLFPDKAYYDRISFNYYDVSSPENRLAVVSTKVTENTGNSGLLPTRNYKNELGFNLKIKGVKLMVTAFQEQLKNGYSFNRIYDQFVYKKFESLTTEGLSPYFNSGEIMVMEDGVENQLASYMDTLYYSYSSPVNGIESLKRGIEYTLELGKINYLKTSVVIDGAYFNVKRQTSVDELYQPTQYYLSDRTQLVGVYEKGEGYIHQRLNSNVRTITHIPKLKMVVSFITQVIWMDKKQTIYEDEQGNPIPYMNLTHGGVTDLYQNVSHPKFIDPVAYYDGEGALQSFDRVSAVDKPLNNLIKSVNNPRNYIPEDLPPVVQLNMRITKEIGDYSTISFFANNIVSHRPSHASDKVYDSYIKRNTSTYFGAEIKIKLNY